MKRRIAINLGAVVGMAALAAGGGGGLTARAAVAADNAAAVTALSTKSSWRIYLTWKTEQVRAADGSLAPVELRKGIPAKTLDTPPPPDGWTQPDFDDSGWERLVGPVPAGSRSLAAMCLRGRFQVDDPARAGDLSLTVSYRGGAAVFLNGKEVARGHLPTGTLTADTPAEDYPKDAYVDPNGMLLQHGFGDPDKYKDRFALRTRSLGPVPIPASALRKGVNVLAIELHRAPTSAALINGHGRNGMEQFYCAWQMLALGGVKLEVRGGAGLSPNPGPPAAFQVWNHSVAARTTAAEFGYPTDPLAPVRIVGCRGGAFSGELVAGAPATIKGLRVTVGPLARTGGEGVIPPEAVQVRCGRLDGYQYGVVPWFEGIEDTVPGEVQAPKGGGLAIQPVWFTVRVPHDAKPGEYAAPIAVSAEGADPVKTALRLSVADWALPDSKDFASHVGLTQSADSVALQYKVALWSDEHWRLLDKTFALLGQVGEDEVYLPLICGTYLGNEQTMVRWVKEAGKPDYTYDFSIATKYLDLAMKHMGKPPVVCLYLWDRQGGTWGPTSKDLGAQTKPASVSLLDRATGAVTRMDAPLWGKPESVPFWKPVIDGLRDILKQRGVERSMMVGLAVDHRPPKETVADLKALAPEAKWLVQSHMAAGGSITTQMIGCGAHVWCSYRLFDPALGRAKPRGQSGYIFCGFPRYGVGGAVEGIKGNNPMFYRVLVEGLMACGHHGFGRVGADFWPLRRDAAGRMHEIFGGDLGDTSVTLRDSTAAVLAPGAAGPISTIRFEMLREGVQEAEARDFIERALADAAVRARLGEALAARCRNLLDERVRIMLRTAGMGMGGVASPSDWPLRWAGPWQDESAQLYALAAEVAKSMK